MNIADDPRFAFQYRWFFQLGEKLMRRYVLPRFEKYDGPIDYIETGVCQGASLVWALENFGRDNGLFVGIDPFLNSRHWHEDEGEGHRAAARANITAWYKGKTPADFTNGISIWNEGSRKPTCQLTAQSSQDYLLTERRPFDVAYCDGSHNADAAILDIILLFRLLRDGGVLIIDDYDRKVRGGRPQVYPAVKAFESCYEGFFDRIFEHQKAIGYVKRPRRRRGFPPILEQGPIIEPSS
jgi:hypothetical protein